MSEKWRTQPPQKSYQQPHARSSTDKFALSEKNTIARVIIFCYLCILGDCKIENCVKL